MGSGSSHILATTGKETQICQIRLKSDECVLFLSRLSSQPLSGDEMDYKIDYNMDYIRQRRDRCEEISPIDIVYPPDYNTFSSSFVSNALAFKYKRKVDRLQRIANSIVENSAEDLDALHQLGSLVLADTRLGDHLPNGVISRIVEFLDDEKYPVEKNYKFQYYSATVLESVVSSNKGAEVKRLAVPLLFKLISSSHDFVQIQALTTLTAIAREFPEYCTTMIQHGVLELLKPLLKDDCIHYVVLKSLGELLIAFCQVNPSLPSDQIQKLSDLICTALQVEYETSLIPITLAFSILSDRKQVEIGTEFARLQSLTSCTSYLIVLSSLRTIGNYVRWGTKKHIEMMLMQDLFVDLVLMLSHRYEIVRKEACWITSNIFSVASGKQIQSIIRMRLPDMLIMQIIKKEELSVKIIAARAIIHAIHGSKRGQFGYFNELISELGAELQETDDEKEILRLIMLALREKGQVKKGKKLSSVFWKI